MYEELHSVGQGHTFQIGRSRPYLSHQSMHIPLTIIIGPRTTGTITMIVIHGWDQLVHPNNNVGRVFGPVGVLKPVGKPNYCKCPLHSFAAHLRANNIDFSVFILHPVSQRDLFGVKPVALRAGIEPPQSPRIVVKFFPRSPKPSPASETAEL